MLNFGLFVLIVDVGAVGSAANDELGALAVDLGDHLVGLGNCRILVVFYRHSTPVTT